MLLAFVTETNASRRRLEAAGATMVPTFYCRRTGDAAWRRATSGERRAQFVYSDDEWRAQFLERPHQPGRLVDGDGYRAVIDDARRLHFVDGDDVDAALRELDVQFLFTTIAAEVPHGFEIVPGFLAILGDVRPTRWALQNGDRM